MNLQVPDESDPTGALKNPPGLKLSGRCTIVLGRFARGVFDSNQCGATGVRGQTDGQAQDLLPWPVGN